MKVAILSLKLHTNYGGLLQAYALQTVLERDGHTVEILSGSNNMPPLKWYKKPICYCKRLTLKIIKDKHISIFYEEQYNKAYSVLSENTNKFISEFLHIREIKSFTDIKKDDYDAYVVGSDQVWRKKYFCLPWNSPLRNAFLGFTKDWNVKRIAYAASFGVDEWEYSETETKECEELAKHFQKIGVRETSAVDLCHKYLNVDATQVLDPTLLLPAETYIDLIKEEPQSDGNLLVYILDENEEKSKLVERIAKERYLQPFRLNKKFNVSGFSIGTVFPKVKVQTWLKGFFDAKFVVTDSFHACAFSIIFGKPFVAILNKNRGATRFITLASLFGLDKNIIFNVSDYDSDSEYSLPDDINERKTSLVTDSIKFLSFR